MIRFLTVGLTSISYRMDKENTDDSPMGNTWLLVIRNLRQCGVARMLSLEWTARYAAREWLSARGPIETAIP